MSRETFQLANLIAGGNPLFLNGEQIWLELPALVGGDEERYDISWKSCVY